MYAAFALLADAANVAADGKLNIMGVFDAVQAAALPATHPRAHVVARLKALAGDAGTHALTVRFTGPGGATIHEVEAELTVHPLPVGAAEIDVPFILPLDLRLTQPGGHAVSIVLDGRPLAQLPLQVMGSAPQPSFPMTGGGSALLS